MNRSARPWIDVRSSAESASVRSALPETNARFQPIPFRKSPVMTSPPASPGTRPASAQAPSRIAPPRPIIGSRPKRSLSQPDSGDETYMPARCSEVATPIVPTVCRWSCR
jgi:hypothetical protein